MNIFKIPFKKNIFFYVFLFGTFLSVLILLLSFILPAFISSNYYQKSLSQLRIQAKAIKNEFANLIAEINSKQNLLLASPFPKEKNEIFALFKKLNINKEREGIGYYNKKGELVLWLGNVIDLKTIFMKEESGNPYQEQKSSLLIHDKASVYLVSFTRVNKDEHIIFYRLLAFIPQFKTPYLKEYHFLKPKLLSNCEIAYWDFQEDVSGSEKFFSKHKDEYIGQPRLQDEIQTIFFPLRNEKNSIMATVTLRSPSLSARTSAKKENILLVFYLFFGTSLLFFLIYLVKIQSFHKEQKPLSIFLVILILSGLRLLFFPLSKLEKIQSLTFFSPAKASFLSFWNFAKSPADIFLTSLFLFLFILGLSTYSRDLFEKKKRRSSLILSVPVNLILVFSSFCLILLFQNILFRLVFHSNINLLRFSFNVSFFLLHLSILLLFLSFFLLILLGLRLASIYSFSIFSSLLAFFLGFGGYFLLFKERNFPLLFLLQALVIVLILTLAIFPKTGKRKGVLLLAFLLSTIFIYTSLHYSTSSRNRSLIQNALQNTIKSHEEWGFFLTEQSLQEIEKKKRSIISFFHNLKPTDLSHTLWERTLIAKFNWYSRLEILNPEGKVLSSFSLNVPSLYRLDFDLPPNREWIILQQSIPLMGKEKVFLVAYKDWFEEEDYLGRMILYLSIDYDMLPFLYSANPYFELVRVTSIPSLNQLNLGFAIFDIKGKLLFNPNKISSGIPPALLQVINSSKDPLWSTFTDKEQKFKCFYFRKNYRIYSLFLPKKNLINYSVEFLKLFFIYLVFLSIFYFFVVGILGKRKFQNPFWSFSNRVYISFIAIAIIPLFLFTFFTRSFFSRIFTQQFTEKAEIRASFAQVAIEDFMFLQQEEQLSLSIPPEYVVLLISSTISNDVNLYQDGKLISSSRREFFDSGLLPELINGETYYKMQYENIPLYTQTQKIGDYSFHTLTIPYFLQDNLLLISLPFPLEQQEISKASEELIEFLFFISVFFGGVVLLFARGIGGMIITPIRKLLAGTKEVSVGNLEVSIQHKPQDEMKTLIDGFNTMVKNLKKHQQELADMSKTVAWAEMARKVAHEIKNPLTPIQLSAEHLLKVFEDKTEDFDQALKESASYIIKEVENLRKIAQEFIEISKETTLYKELFNIKGTIQETIEPYKKTLSERIKFKETYSGRDFSFEGDKAKIKIAVRNIITNALEAIQDQGIIEINVSGQKTGIRIEIKDTGIGIRRDMLDKIFEPYYSTKDVGTGLGLPIAKKIIEDHGGSIKASSKEKSGSKILIKLPRSKSSQTQ